MHAFLRGGAGTGESPARVARAVASPTNLGRLSAACQFKVTQPDSRMLIGVHDRIDKRGPSQLEFFAWNSERFHIYPHRGERVYSFLVFSQQYTDGGRVVRSLPELA